MRYEEPHLKLSVPLSVLRKIEECLYREISTAHSLREQGYRVSRRSFMDNERAYTFVSEALVSHEAESIIGDALSDENLKSSFPPRKKKRVAKKQRD